MAQDVETLRISRHEPIFNAVVHHLDKVAGTIRSAVQVALLGRAGPAVAAGSAGGGWEARRQRSEEGLQTLHHRWLPTNHQAIASLGTPNAAARAHVHVMQPARPQ